MYLYLSIWRYDSCFKSDVLQTSVRSARFSINIPNPFSIHSGMFGEVRIHFGKVDHSEFRCCIIT